MMRDRRKGSSISEFGPAMFVFLIAIFFPMIDLLGLAMGYGICWYINYKISNQVARSRQAQATTIADEVVGSVMRTGFASFLKLQQGDIKVAAPVFDNNAAPPTVQVTTEVTTKPFLSIPFWKAVPGLNAPVTFSISSQLTRESTL